MILSSIVWVQTDGFAVAIKRLALCAIARKKLLIACLFIHQGLSPVGLTVCIMVRNNGNIVVEMVSVLFCGSVQAHRYLGATRATCVSVVCI